jgi:hypothetical protein
MYNMNDKIIPKPISTPSGEKNYVIHGDVLHREDGPAVVGYNGKKEWWVNGKRHRLDGPAVIKDFGTYKEWWVDGEQVEEVDVVQRQVLDKVSPETKEVFRDILRDV